MIRRPEWVAHVQPHHGSRVGAYAPIRVRAFTRRGAHLNARRQGALLWPSADVITVQTLRPAGVP